MRIEVVHAGATLAEFQHDAQGRLLVPFQQVPRPGAVAGPDLVPLMHSKPIDTKRWPDPPHQAFANLDFRDMRRLEFFVRTYGISGHFCNLDRSNGVWFVDRALLQKWQDRLRAAWGQFIAHDYEGHANGPRNLSAYRGKENLWFHPRSLTIDAKGHLAVSDLWSYICVCFITDCTAGLTKVCEFEGCKFLRYFLKSRTDQRFCTKQCRARHNMKEWRKSLRNQKHERAVRRKRSKRIRQKK
jgi:hypothetical protein